MKRSKRGLYYAAVIFLFLTHQVRTQEQNQTPANDGKTRLVYGLVVDNSGSLRSNLVEVVDAGKLIVNSHQPGDEVFLVRFINSEKIKILQDFTSNKAALIDSLDGMYVEGGSSAIVDAVYFSLQHLLEENSADRSASRRVLILITDGDERASHQTLEKVLKLAREKRVSVYTIGLVHALNQQGANTKKRATNLLKRLTDESGGRAYFPETMAEVRNIAGGILDDIRKQ